MKEKKILICIIGGSGSGKSTLEDEIIIHDGFSKAISITTRTKRDGEHNGREYHFVDKATFTQLETDGKLVESTNFDDNYYGLSRTELNKNDDHLVFVVEPNGYIDIMDYITENNIPITTITIFMDIAEKERFKNMIKRGDNPVSIQERLKAEQICSDFKKFNIEANIRVTKLHSATHDTVMDDINKFISLINQ